MTPVEEWNQFFSENFPDGAIITLLNGPEEAAPSDDSPQFVTDRILTVSVQDNDHPQITFTDFGSNRTFMFDVASVEERPFGCFIETTESKQPSLLISRDLSDELKQAIQEEVGGY